ncbi:MAG: hypothetical protein JKY01_01740 [Pseudomonadales bacterium]|nr:hypothetical protein [Pseudomonadales bacterium]
MSHVKIKAPSWNTIPSYFLLTIAGLMVFSINILVQGPMIQADEGSYLANAAALAGYPNDLASSYHSGYSMLIAPAFWIANTPQEIWIVVKAINALLFVIIVNNLWLIAKYLNPNTSPENRVTSVALVSLYPMWVIMAGYSFAQIAFVPVFLLMFIMYLRSTREKKGARSWLILGVTSGFLYWIHPIAVAPLIALSIGTAYISWQRNSYMPFLAQVLATIAMVLIYRNGITPWLHSQMSISGNPANLHYPDPTRLLTPLTSISGIKEIISRIAGQLFYLSVGTVGLIWLGLFTITEKALQKSDAIDKDTNIENRSTAIFIWLSFLTAIVIPALMFSSNPEAQRLDHWMYGRYVEGVIAPILLVGVLSPSLRKMLWAIPIASLCAILMAYGMKDVLHTAYFNISAFWQSFVLKEHGVWIWLLAGCALIILTVAVPRKVSILLIATIFSYSSYLQIKWHNKDSENASNRWNAALQVRDQFTPGSCVGFDHSGIDTYVKHTFWFDFGFILYDYELKNLSFDQWLKSCNGPLFTYTRSFNDKKTEVYPIAMSSNGGPIAWMKGNPPEASAYPMVVSERSVALLRALGSGWHDLEKAHIWSSKQAQLKLPIPEICDSRACALMLYVSVYGASKERPVDVNLELGVEGDTQLKLLSYRNSSIQKISIQLPNNQPILSLSIHIPNAISPKNLRGVSDKRVLGVALHSIELVTSTPLSSTNKE